MVFHLPLRQAEGFLGSILRIMDLDLESPDHTTLSRRGEGLVLDLRAVARNGPVHLLIDSSGLAAFGGGEWAVDLPKVPQAHLPGGRRPPRRALHRQQASR